MSLPWGFGDIYWINFYDLGGIVPHLTPMYIGLKIKGGPKNVFDKSWKPALSVTLAVTTMGDMAAIPPMEDRVAVPPMGDRVAVPAMGDWVAVPTMGDRVAVPNMGDRVAVPPMGDMAALSANLVVNEILPSANFPTVRFGNFYLNRLPYLKLKVL